MTPGNPQTCEESRQHALPLVVRVERDAPPARTDALEGAARAVLLFLTDPRATDGEWAEAVRAWEDARIRKVVRRARGAAWRRALALPGITVSHRTAELRVFPPVRSTTGRQTWPGFRSQAPSWQIPSRRAARDPRPRALRCSGSTPTCP